MQYISSKSNALVVRLAKLKDKKYRKAEGLFKFDGIKLFEEAVQSGVSLEYVIICESQAHRVQELVEQKIAEFNVQTNLYMLSEDAFLKLTDEQAPEGVICIAKNLENIENGDNFDGIDLKNSTVLMLESVRDAGNMGTIIRSARAFGIDALIISSDCADLYNSKTIRAAMGALFTQKIIIVDSITLAVSALRESGVRVFAAALNREAKRLSDISLKLGDAILIGNEGHGLSGEAIDACDDCVFIPMESGSESLNAGVAASVCMWELYKIK